MAKLKAFAEGAKLVGGVLGEVVGAATGVQDLVQLGTSLTEQRQSMIAIPEIYSSDYRLKLEDARRILEEDGLKVEAVAAQPDIEYKDCANLEVVATNYKLGKKVKPGTRIIVRYVTTKVIKASQKLFEESERLKAEEEQKKAEAASEKIHKKAEKNEKTKLKLNATVGNIQRGVKVTFMKSLDTLMEIK